MAEITVHRNEDEIKRLKRALAYGMLNLGYFIETQAKTKCPYKTGNLRRSIHTVGFHDGSVLASTADRKPPDYGQDRRASGVIVGTNTGYGIFVELGTIKMKPRAFLQPAASAGLAKGEALIIEGARAHWSASVG